MIHSLERVNIIRSSPEAPLLSSPMSDRSDCKLSGHLQLHFICIGFNVAPLCPIVFITATRTGSPGANSTNKHGQTFGSHQFMRFIPPSAEAPPFQLAISVFRITASSLTSGITLILTTSEYPTNFLGKNQLEMLIVWWPGTILQLQNFQISGHDKLLVPSTCLLVSPLRNLNARL